SPFVVMAGGDGEVRAAQRVGDGLERQTEGVEARSIDVDVHLAVGAAAHGDRRDPVDLFERRADDVVGELPRLAEGTLAPYRVRQDRRRRDVEAGDRRLFDVLGELETGL